jgi:hypothetical protein
MAAHDAVVDLVIHATEGLLDASAPGAAHTARGFDHRWTLWSPGLRPGPERPFFFQTAREMADAIESIGRETGWLASHGEVAEYVEKLLGVELQQRRDRIAYFVDQMRETAAPRLGPAAPTERVTPALPSRPTEPAPTAKGTRRNIDDPSVSLSSPLEAENPAKL